MSSWKWWGTSVALAVTAGLALGALIDSSVGWMVGLIGGAALLVLPEKQRTTRSIIVTFLFVAVGAALFYFLRGRRIR